MKKILTALIISFTTLLVSAVASTSSHSKEYRDHGQERDNKSDKRSRDSNDNEDYRKDREERGVKRLKQHKWQTGYVMPQHYRGNSYKADYKDNNLPKPSRSQQWYKVNNDFILVDSDNNNILKIQTD